MQIPRTLTTTTTATAARINEQQTLIRQNKNENESKYANKQQNKQVNRTTHAHEKQRRKKTIEFTLKLQWRVCYALSTKIRYKCDTTVYNELTAKSFLCELVDENRKKMYGKFCGSCPCGIIGIMVGKCAAHTVAVKPVRKCRYGRKWSCCKRNVRAQQELAAHTCEKPTNFILLFNKRIFYAKLYATHARTFIVCFDCNSKPLSTYTNSYAYERRNERMHIIHAYCCLASGCCSMMKNFSQRRSIEQRSVERAEQMSNSQRLNIVVGYGNRSRATATTTSTSTTSNSTMLPKRMSHFR